MTEDASPGAAAELIQLLWGEIPLSKEAHVLQIMRDQGLYELWEASFDVWH